MVSGVVSASPVLAFPAKGLVWKREICLKRCRGLNRVRAVAEEEEDQMLEVVPPPEGVTMPNRVPEIPPGRFGFVEYAERINSRAAMIGFFGILILELIANKGILELLGFNVGSGLGFEI